MADWNADALPALCRRADAPGARASRPRARGAVASAVDLGCGPGNSHGASGRALSRRRRSSASTPRRTCCGRPASACPARGFEIGDIAAISRRARRSISSSPMPPSNGCPTTSGFCPRSSASSRRAARSPCRCRTISTSRRTGSMREVASGRRFASTLGDAGDACEPGSFPPRPITTSLSPAGADDRHLANDLRPRDGRRPN